MRASACITLGFLAALAAGCGPRIEVVATRCHPVRTEDGESVAFAATIETSGYANRQMVYRVRILDSSLRPIPSVTRRYSDAEGKVAAATSLMVLRSPWTFEDTTVAIPVPELELKPEHMPAHAEFALLTPRGEMLRRTIQPLPPGVGPAPARRTATAAPPERAAPPVAARRPAEPAEPQPVGDLFSLLYEAYGRQGAGRVAAPTEAPTSGSGEETARSRPQRPGSAAAPAWDDGDGSEQAAEMTAGSSAGDESGSARDGGGGSGAQDGAAPRRRALRDEAAPADRAYRIYVVQPGDTLTRIAKRLYGETGRWVDIFQLNRDRLDSPDLIYEGMEIRVPSDE